MTTEITFVEWLESTAELRASLLAYSTTPLPTDAGERHNEISLAIERGEKAGELLADAESFLTQADAQAVLEVRRTHDDLTADERKKLAKDKVRDVQRLVDGLSVVVKAINSRVFALMNANRSRL